MIHSMQNSHGVWNAVHNLAAVCLGVMLNRVPMLCTASHLGMQF